MTISKRFIRGALATALLLPASAALAGITWQFTGTGSLTSGGVTATPTAKSFTSGASNDQIANGTLFFYGGNGFGVRNADCCTNDPGEDASPEHSVDNEGRADYVLFSFSQAINLQSITAGWRATDSDLSVLAFNGNALPAMDGNNHAALVGQGWKLIGNYNGATASASGDGTDTTINTGSSFASRWWLVGGYDSRWATNGAINQTGVNGGNDFVKILSLYGNKPSNGVPEPSALLLLGVAMIGLYATRRTGRTALRAA